MVEYLEGITMFKRSIFPFVFGAFFVGLGAGNVMSLGEYVSILLAVLGGAMGAYSVSIWKGY